MVVSFISPSDLVGENRQSVCIATPSSGLGEGSWMTGLQAPKIAHFFPLVSVDQLKDNLSLHKAYLD